MSVKQNRELEFVDTNILVYAYDSSSSAKRTKAMDLLIKLWNSGNGALSIQVMQEFYITVTQKIPHPVTPQTAAQIIEDLGNWEHHLPDVSDLLTAVNIQQSNRISFWDALIVASAKKMGCTVIWTEI